MWGQFMGSVTTRRMWVMRVCSNIMLPTARTVTTGAGRGSGTFMSGQGRRCWQFGGEMGDWRVAPFTGLKSTG